MKKIVASIITIGDELLIGQVIDTNSAFIAIELNRIGVPVSRRMAVGDDYDAIRNALDQELKENNLVVVTGGLGPTSDDITKPLLCDYFGGKLVMNEAVLQHVRYLFEKVYGRPMIERNSKQAELPDNCLVLHNALGTAPGMWFEKDGKVLIALPGVPFEMAELMTREVIPAIRKKFKQPAIEHRTLLTAGIGESFLAERISAFEAALPAAIKLAYLPHYGMVRLRLSMVDPGEETPASLIDDQFHKLQLLLADVMVTATDETPQQVLAKLLVEKHRTLGTAESCTGGYIAQLFTAMPGASNYYKGSIISYDNSVKQRLLKVPLKTIEDTGAVSEETVMEMVKGGLDALKTDFLIAVTGIMGPDGGSMEKPVGTVWIGVGNNQEIITKKFRFGFDRRRNIELTAMNALELLRKFILNQFPESKTNSH